MKQFAQRGRIVPETGDAAMREIFVRSFRLIYLVQDQAIFIVGFIHGARDLAGLWEDQDEG